MKRKSWLRKSGPFKCVSLVNGYILVKPSWSQYGSVWNAQDGGGPGLMGRMSLASQLEDWLNDIYNTDQINEAEGRIKLHDDNLVESEIEAQREGWRGYWAFYDDATKRFTHFAQSKAGVEIQMLDKKPKGRITRIDVK